MKQCLPLFFTLITITTLSLSAMQNKPKKKESELINFGIGSIAGLTEVSMHHWLWWLKTRLQQNKPALQEVIQAYKKKRLFKTVYRGYYVNLGSYIPITAIQVSVSSSIKDQFSEQGFTGSTVSSIIGGGISGIFASFTDLIMIQQNLYLQNPQKARANIIQTIKNIIKDYGYKGLLAGIEHQILRDSIFTFGYFALTPTIKRNLEELDVPPGLAHIIGGIGSGLISSFITHPNDIIKTQLQSLPGRTSSLSISKNIWSTSGVKGFWKGYLPRGIRRSMATVVLSTVTEKGKQLAYGKN